MSLKVCDLHFGYRRGFQSFPVLKGLSFEALPGEVTAVAGPNGAGKSTLLKCLAGVLPAAGVSWKGQDLRGFSRYDFAHRIGYMVQENAPPSRLTVLETVLLGRLHALRLRVPRETLEQAWAMLERLRLSELAQRPLASLSGGQRRMVYIAQTLLGDPDILILDEPTANLDLPRELEVLRLMRAMTAERGLVTLVTLHDLNSISRFAHRVLLMKDGIIAAQGRPSEALTAQSIEEVYGVRTRLLDDREGPVILPELS